MKEMNIYHVMLGVAIGAGGVIVGMQVFTLAKRKRKKKKYTPKHRHSSPHAISNQAVPSLFHSPGKLIFNINLTILTFS